MSRTVASTTAALSLQTNIEALMSKRIPAAVMAGIAAIALSVPSVGLATKGGAPHSTKPCPTHSHSGKRKGSGKGKKNGVSKGKKCGTK
jgi:hypothetical protein